ncbi:MAG: alpha/beta fold hydrolase, partial [Euryarchaeota archaeon]|nr:alpha/beta fold hydrolase [Euryarchaeota archaeon]
MARVYTGLDVEGDFEGRFPWRSQRLDVGGGVKMAYVDEGPRDAPVTFLLLHGNPTWGYLYRDFIRPLARHHRVVVPDYVGFGRSDKPRDPAYYSLDRHIENLTKLLAHLKARNVVPVVQDWGGPIGMGWATAHPERVAGCVVFNTWAFVRDPPMKLPWLFRFLVLGKGGWRRATKKNVFTEIFIGKAQKKNDRDLAPYRAPHPTPADRTGVARFAQMIPPTDHPDHESWATMDRIEAGLSKLASKPALVVWAMQDPAFRKPFLERWTRLFR